MVGDSPLSLRLRKLHVAGRFAMGTPGCALRSPVTITIPGGDEAAGVDVAPGAVYDVHGYVQVGGSSPLSPWNAHILLEVTMKSKKLDFKLLGTIWIAVLSKGSIHPSINSSSNNSSYIQFGMACSILNLPASPHRGAHGRGWQTQRRVVRVPSGYWSPCHGAWGIPS